jgi:Na+-translocating ferredoxin:NAD+ oxidoreductase RnfC subunit
MNEKMCNEMAGTLDKVKDIVISNMFREDHDTSDSSLMKTRAHQIKKIIDYLKLFSEVNTELINKEKTKTKKTHRYPISRNFIEATQCMNDIL